MSQTMTSERGQKTEAKTYKNYIGGHWVESKSGRTFTSMNPAHKDQVLGVMQASNADDVNAAIEAAQKASTGGGIRPRRRGARSSSRPPCFSRRVRRSWRG